ncbi:MAG: adenosylcobinamide-GDP ribazoletransferase [Roseobacter sp.]
MENDKRPRFLTDIVLAFCLLTRLPMPHLPSEAFKQGARAIWAYALVGIFVGTVLLGIGTASLALELPSSLAAGLMIAAGFLLTGGLHEDGLADTADGVWGGQTKEQRLEIMKDSRIGTYGTLSLILIIGLRWVAFAALLPAAPTAILVAATVSRTSMTILMISLPHARSDGLSRSLGSATRSSVVLGWFIALLCAGLCLGVTGWITVLPACLSAAVLHLLARTKLGGQSGDILGATQQISEALILITLVALLA